MRVLHAAAIPWLSPGIFSQICAEHDAAKKLGIPWDNALMTPGGLVFGETFNRVRENGPENERSGRRLIKRVRNQSKLSSQFFGWLHEVQPDYDLILLRYRVHDGNLNKFARNSYVPIMTVHHTLEIRQLSTEGRMGDLRAASERVVGPRTLRRMKGLVGVTDEILKYELARVAGLNLAGFVYPNGISGERTPVGDAREGTKEFLFVATHFDSWYGLDLLLKSMAYTCDEFVLHIVGTLETKDEILARSDPRVVVHGRMNAKGIRHLAERCSLGIAALALSRLGLSEACSLKVRDYLSMGLPAFGTYREILPRDFSYYVHGKPEISALIAAAQSFADASRDQVHSASMPHIRKDTLLKVLYTELLNS